MERPGGMAMCFFSWPYFGSREDTQMFDGVLFNVVCFKCITIGPLYYYIYMCFLFALILLELMLCLFF